MLIVIQVSYSVVDLQSEMVCNPVIQRVHISSSADLSHTWSNLFRGRYQFSVVAFTSQGPGDTASFMLSTLPDNGMLVANGYMVTWLATCSYDDTPKFIR